MLNKNKFVIFLIAGVIIVGGYLTLTFSGEQDDTEPTPEEVVETPEPLSAFSWRFSEASTNNPDGNRQTDVFLTAEYGQAGSEEYLIDTVDGSCSELEGESHEGDVSNTGKVQCYYAGLGQYYRITQASDSYWVEKKLFEEALPDVVPPEYEWEVISSFSLQK